MKLLNTWFLSCCLSKPTVTTRSENLIPLSRATSTPAAEITIEDSEQVLTLLGKLPFKKRKMSHPIQTPIEVPTEIIRVYLLESYMDPEDLQFCSKLQERIRSGLSWEKALYGNVTATTEPSETAAAIMATMQSEIKAGKTCLEAFGTAIHPFPSKIFSILEELVKHGIDFSKDAEFQEKAKNVPPLYIDKFSSLIRDGFSALEANTVVHVQRLAAHMHRYSRLNLLMDHLTPELKLFWESIQSKIKSKVKWQSALFGSRKNAKANQETMILMGKVEAELKEGAPYLSAIEYAIKSGPDSFSPVQEILVRENKEWEAELKLPKHQEVAKRLSIGKLKSQADLIAAGLHWYEARAILFIRTTQTFIPRNQENDVLSDVDDASTDSKSEEIADNNQKVNRFDAQVGRFQQQTDVLNKDSSTFPGTEAPITYNIMNELPPSIIQYWTKIEKRIQNGSTWHEAVYEDVKAFGVEETKFLEFMNCLQKRVRRNAKISDAVQTCISERKTAAISALPSLQLAVKGGRDWKTALRGIEASFQNDAIFGPIQGSLNQIADEISKGKYWAEAAALVFLRNYQFGQ